MISLPNKKYDIIYADPPWSFKTYSEKGKDRSPENHYGVMSLKLNGLKQVIHRHSMQLI